MWRRNTKMGKKGDKNKIQCLNRRASEMGPKATEFLPSMFLEWGEQILCLSTINWRDSWFVVVTVSNCIDYAGHNPQNDKGPGS